MARKRIGQLSWFDGAVGLAQKRRRDRLTEIAALLDWRPFEALLSEIHSSRRGEPSYPPLAMFKVLLLQRWYDLSDPAMEEALFDRLSFRRFAGLALEDDTPDHATIFRFREQLPRSLMQLGGASCRQRVGSEVSLTGVAGLLQKKIINI